MSHFNLGYLLLAALAASPLRAADPVRLTTDKSTQSLQVQAGMHGVVFLAIGPLAVPPIPIGGIDLDVVPHHVFSLGEFAAGDKMLFFVPRSLSGLCAEAVIVDPDSFVMHDSNVAHLEDAFADMIEATFRAVLGSTDGIPPFFTVGASLTAPTTGFEFLFDWVKTEKGVTNVYLRLIEPVDIVIPVLWLHQQVVPLGTEVGDLVRVWMVRLKRGQPGPDDYRLMAELPVIRW